MPGSPGPGGRYWSSSVRPRSFTCRRASCSAADRAYWRPPRERDGQVPQRDDQGPKSPSPAGLPVVGAPRLPAGHDDDFPHDAGDLFDAIMVDPPAQPVHVPPVRPPVEPASAGPLLPPAPTGTDIDVDIDDPEPEPPPARAAERLAPAPQPALQSAPQPAPQPPAGAARFRPAAPGPTPAPRPPGLNLSKPSLSAASLFSPPGRGLGGGGQRPGPGQHALAQSAAAGVQDHRARAGTRDDRRASGTAQAAPGRGFASDRDCGRGPASASSWRSLSSVGGSWARSCTAPGSTGRDCPGPACDRRRSTLERARARVCFAEPRGPGEQAGAQRRRARWPAGLLTTWCRERRQHRR